MWRMEQRDSEKIINWPVERERERERESRFPPSRSTILSSAPCVLHRASHSNFYSLCEAPGQVALFLGFFAREGGGFASFVL